jgi:hypothetical protein
MSEEITDQTVIETLLSEAQYLQLGLCKDDRPYIVPMSFGYNKGVIYLHSAKTGTKMDILRSNRNVCFEVDYVHTILHGAHPCSYNIKYQSIVGFGTATILKQEQEIREGLRCLIDHYHTGEYNIHDLNINRVAVNRIDIVEMHGKQNGMENE